MLKAEKWARIKYQPCLPLGDNNSKITGSVRNIEVSKEAAGEGMVLLKNNNNILPLKKGTKVAVFGKTQIDYLKGGGGSGDVNCEYVINIYDGLKAKKSIDVFDALSLYYKDCVESAYKDGARIGKVKEVEVPTDLLEKAKAYADVAIITLNRYEGEGGESKNTEEDPYFYLTQEEKNMIDAVCKNFDKVVVLLNSGSIIDVSWCACNDKIDAVLMAWQAGIEGGLTTADVLVGDINPSGRMVDTCATSFDDYPSSEGFFESNDYVKYTEDIFVGYRYFETIPNMKEKVLYPFGYGLSYTDFQISTKAAGLIDEKIVITVEVKNIGEVSGKEVVQVYFSAPTGKITKAARELCAFGKTKLLAPNETQTLVLSFDVNDMASYDDMGDVEKSAYVMEKGEYKIYVGKNVRDAEEIEYKYVLNENKICQKLTEYCTPENLGKRLMANGEYIDVPDKKYIPKDFPCTYHCEEKIPEAADRKKLIDVYNGDISLDEFIQQLTNEEMAGLLAGQKCTGVANTCGMGNLEDFGIPSPMTVDGPAGVRLETWTGVTTTAFPIATMLACTWNTELVEKVGVAGALETKENNLSIWLTPALNIHRSPLCGRNFEYFSEDPFLSGKMAAAMVRGIQSQNIVATPKHFACNNKETNRLESNSIVSERALREIYIKGFEICIKESDPKLVMTAYNLINGVRSSENAELITGILRNEWGYQALVTTDWWNHAKQFKEIKAGNDIKMPIGDEIDSIINNNTRDELAVCVKRLLEMILWLE